MKKILVVGFGIMGCRHVQSLLDDKNFAVFVVEVSEENIKINTDRIGVSREEIKWIAGLEDVDQSIDLAIIATSSGPRFNIMRSLLEKGVKHFLLEKIVFQSASQFEEIIRLLDKYKAKAYCNFVNRYFNVYNIIKQEYRENGLLEMIVVGGEFGLGCNAIHYMDIFQFITADNKISIESSSLAIAELENRRGKEYMEFTGMINVSNGKNDRLLLIADKGYSGGVHIHVSFLNKKLVLSEQTQKVYVKEGASLSSDDFAIIPTSRLTSGIVKDILNGNCRLTQVHETAPAHKALFHHFNKMLYGDTADETLCPIT